MAKQSPVDSWDAVMLGLGVLLIAVSFNMGQADIATEIDFLRNAGGVLIGTACLDIIFGER